MEPFEIEKYKEIALRRRWWIIIPFLVSTLIGIGLGLKLPKSYRASTLILVQAQKVPTSYVRGIISVDIGDRLRTITQQVTSRTNLEKIIDEFNLYNESGRQMFMEAKIERIRKKITVNVIGGGRQGTNAFQIFFEGKYPKIVADVANALSSYFITENLKLREDHAIGTSDFLADEVDSVKRRLEEKDGLLTKYRQRYMGAMPEQLQTNLSILGRLQNQLEQLNSNLRAAEERKLIIQQQISNAEMMKKQMAEPGMDNSLVTIDTFASSQDTDSKEIISLKDKLASLEGRYTANHPDVMRLKRMIAKIEAEQTESITEKEESETAINEMEPKPGFSMIDLLKPQLHQIDIEIKNLKIEINKVKSQVELYGHRVEETPQREQEILFLTRDYDNLKALYDSLLKRKLEAEIAVNLERKQKGEQGDHGHLL
jgi:polysaccharide chain length determinant protein (PEP-CTERM system associated)